jgi:hypothetical protein
MSKWMRAVHQVVQPGFGDMGIYLGCGDMCVSEQHLNSSQVCTMIEQVRGKCMA